MENMLDKIKHSVRNIFKINRKNVIIKTNDVNFSMDENSDISMIPIINYHVIVICGLLFLLVAGIWANFAVMDVVTVGQGKVIPSSNMQVIQNLEGGIIKDILVKIGDVVSPEQELMIIDDTRFVSSLKESETQIYGLKAKIARLTAESNDAELLFPKDIEDKYPQYVTSERNLYHSSEKELEVKLNILQDEVKQKSQELIASKGKKEQIQRSLELVKKEFELTQPLAKSGAVSPVEVLRLERTVNDLQGDLQQTELSIPKLEASLSSAKSKMNELRASDKTEALTELNKAKAEYNKLVETTKAATDRVTRTIIRSPVKGIINQVKVTTVGGIIQPGQDLLTIVPLNDTLLIEAKIRPVDIGFLRPGLAATIKVSAYDFSIYGGLKGTVEHISADTIKDEKGNPFYVIRVRTSGRNYLLGKHGERLNIIAGMSVTVDVLTGHKTVLEYLLQPIIKAKQSAMRER